MPAVEPGDCDSYEVVVLGAGYAGMMAALRLARGNPPLRIALVGAQEQFVERVRLQESIVAAVPPRIPSISAFLAGAPIEFIRARLTSLDPTQRRIRIATDTRTREIGFDQLVYALGSTIDVEAIPGVAEHAFRLEVGAGARSAAALRLRLRETADRLQRVIVIGGAETGIEAAGEIKTASPNADVVLLSRSRCASARGAGVEEAVRRELEELGVRLVDGEEVIAVRSNEVIAESGRAFPYDICVWSGGLRSAAFAADAGLATDGRGRIWVDPNLRSVSHPYILACGDAAHPIAPTGAPYRPSAFAALVSGAYTADCIAARRAKRRLRPFSFSTFGQGIAIGRRGVGFFSYPDDRQTAFIVKGSAARKVRNFFVWFVTFTLKLERRWPGFFFWPGRARVSWQQATSAVQGRLSERKPWTA
jgi:NADH:ubiquinone reductase (H+-translocating)